MNYIGNSINNNLECIKKYFIKHKFIWNILLELLFILSSVVLVWHYWNVNAIPYDFDSAFHWHRIVEITKDIEHGIFPAFNHYTYPIGGATQITYPWLFLVPVCILKIVGISSVHCMIILKACLFLIGLNISYFSCIHIKRSKSISLLFTILYMYGSFVVYYIISDSDIGYSIALAFTPLVLFGFLDLLRNNKWKMMTIGMILIAYGHIISSIILLMFGFILCILFLNSFDKVKIISLIKSIIFYIFSTMLIWMPIFILLLNNKIRYPILRHPYSYYTTLIPLSLTDFAQSILNATTPLDWVAMIICIILWKKLGYRKIKLLLIAIIPWFLCGNWFSNGILNNSFIAHVFQVPYRLCFLSHIILSYLLATIIIKHMRKSSKKNVSLVIITLVIIVISVMFMGLVMSIQSSYTKSFPTARMVMDNKKKYANVFVKHQLEFNNDYMNNKRFLEIFSPNDYLPLSSLKYSHNPFKIKTVANSKARGFSRKNNIIVSNNGKKNNLMIPIVSYHMQKYIVYNNNHKKSSKVRHNLLVTKLSKGNNRLSFRTPLSWYWYIILIISISSIVTFIVI